MLLAAASMSKARSRLVVTPPGIPAVLLGDSLTDPSYGLSTFYWMNGVNGGVLKAVHNAGIGGDTIANVLARVDNDYADSPTGIAGLGTLGWVIVRIGTNTARAGTGVAGVTAAYTSLFAACAGYADKVVILAVPPLGGAEQSFNTHVIDYNAWLETHAAANGYIFIDDCINLRDGSDEQIADYFNADGVHFIGKGVYKAGIDGGALLASHLPSYASPLSTDAADVYPAQPQWHPNPTITGTSGTKGSGITGTVASSITVGPNGANVEAVCSIVDDTTDWQRVAITRSGGNGTGVYITSTMAGRSITTTDPERLDTMLEFRFNSFVTTNVKFVKVWVQGATSGEKLVPEMDLLLGDAGTVTDTVVLRHARLRAGAATQSGATMYIEIQFSNSFGPAADIGTIDFRCVTVRG